MGDNGTMYKILIATLLLAAAYAQLPQPCETPILWESDVTFFEPLKNEDILARVFYDGINKRSASFDIIQIGAKRSFYHFIAISSENKLYAIEHKDGARTCTVSDLDQPWRPYGVPKNATFVTQSNIGIGLFVNIWYEQHDGYKWEGTFTNDGCIPITVNEVVPGRGFMHMGFFDFVIGNHDPNVYIPPPECF